MLDTRCVVTRHVARINRAMPASALARQPNASTVPQPAKRERIPPRIAQAVKLLLSGECKTQKAAAERAGITASHLCECLTKPKIQAFIARETRRTITHGQMRASARLVELVDAGSEHVSLDAAKHVLAIEGIRPPDQGQVNVNVGVSVGYVIDLSGAPAVAQPVVQASDDERQAAISTTYTRNSGHGS